MTLYEKTQQLKADRLHLEQAIEALKTSSPIPKGNSLSEVLKNQFDALATQADRDRSIEMMARMLDQQLLDVQAHERALQLSSQRVNHGLNRLKDLKFKFDGQMMEAQVLIDEIANLSESLEADRVEVGHTKPLVRIVGTFAAPTVEVG